jgi:glycosyltransferase involved in cell wall biosynthesis
VSVVIPTYNRRRLLLATLESVFTQTFRDYEVIVVDDGSPDDTAAALEPLVRAGRVRHVHQANAGPAVARNQGVREARGEFVAVLDDDDLWPPDKLEWQVEALRERPDAVLVYGYMEAFGTERPWRWPPPDGPTGWVRDAFLAKNWIRSPGQTLIRASAIDAVGGFDPTLWSADDWDLYLRLAARGPFLYRHRHALSYRAHHDNLSKKAWLLLRHACRVHRRHAGALPRPGNARLWLRCRLSILHTFVNELKARGRAEIAKRAGGARWTA